MWKQRTKHDHSAAFVICHLQDIAKITWRVEHGCIIDAAYMGGGK